MRLSTATPLPTALVLFCFLQAISALSLTTFQQINGFSTVCTNAYNTPLTDCSNSDFDGQGCSAKCIGFLDSLTNAMEEACAGTIAYPNTLIGLFFRGEGVQTLCPNAGGSSSASGGGNGYGQSGGQNGAIGPAVQSTAREASSSTTSTSTSTSSTTSSSTTSTSSTPQAAVTSLTTTVVPTTVTPEPTTTSVAVVGITVTPESSSDASTSTSHTESSTSSSGTSTSTSNGNGGGTPLDIGSSACHDAAVSVWLFALIAGSAGAVWLL